MEATTEHRLYPKVLEALANIRPFLEADGGDVNLISIDENNTVAVELLGACSTCSMSAMTLKAGIEESIKKACPEVIAVVATNG